VRAMEPRAAAALVLLGITIVCGIWLSHSGRPLNVLALTLHKSIAVGAVVLAVLAVVPWRGAAHIPAFPLTLLILLGALTLVLFVTGAFLSLGKPLPGFVLTVHKLATLLAIAAAALVSWDPVTGGH
jgi:hypothetical protein